MKKAELIRWIQIDIHLKKNHTEWTWSANTIWVKVFLFRHVIAILFICLPMFCYVFISLLVQVFLPMFLLVSFLDPYWSYIFLSLLCGLCFCFCFCFFALVMPVHHLLFLFGYFSFAHVAASNIILSIILLVLIRM